MRRRFSRLTRRTVIGAFAGLGFAPPAAVGLAQITTSSGPTLAATTTTESQTTGTQATTSGDESESGDDQGENEQGDGDFQSEHGNRTTTTGSSTSTSTTLSSTTTTGGEAGAQGNGQEKMDVCHQTGNGGEHTINIAAPAIPAHVAHGDTVGACSGTSTRGGTTTTTPTTSTSTTTGKKPHKPKKENLHASSHSATTGSTSHGNSGHVKSGKSS